MSVRRIKYSQQEYENIINFLIKINEKKEHMNWNYARFEWGILHPEADYTLQNKIGIWKDDEEIVGVALYDMYLGKGFCAAIDGYEHLLQEIYEYASENLSDENGIGISVNEAHESAIKVLNNMGFKPVEQIETMLKLKLDRKYEAKLPEKYHIEEVRLPENKEKYQYVIWRGFDHDKNDYEAFKEYYNDAVVCYPNMNPRYTLVAVTDDGEYVACCGCWYNQKTDYVYIEPVCVVPECREEGIAKSLLFETFNRCMEDGAKEAYVLSDMEFYKKLGFGEYSNHRFYWSV